MTPHRTHRPLAGLPAARAVARVLSGRRCARHAHARHPSRARQKHTAHRHCMPDRT